MTKRHADKGAEAAPKKQKLKESEADDKVKVLETAYREALSTYKADKTNKDLRRAKSAAKKAWDEAVAASADGEQLLCRDCSHMFIFAPEEREFYVERSWDHTPTRCPSCQEAYTTRLEDRSKRDNNNGKNMCYAFQRGECIRGERCKFSHDLKHGGKNSNIGGSKAMPLKKNPCYAFLKGECTWGDGCKYSHSQAN